MSSSRFLTLRVILEILRRKKERERARSRVPEVQIPLGCTFTWIHQG